MFKFFNNHNKDMITEYIYYSKEGYPITSFKLRLEHYSVVYNAKPTSIHDHRYTFTFHKQFKRLVNTAHNDVFGYPLYKDISYKPFDTVSIMRRIKIDKITNNIK